LNVSKTGYVTYDSGSMTLARGSKMQNIDIRLPHMPPAVNSEGVSAGGITATQVTIFFITQANCSAFVQFGPQSNANYLYQTPAKTNKNSFYFDLLGLTPGTAYKYKVVLQDDSSNTVVAKEGSFTTTQAVIGLNAMVNNITGNSAKLNIDSTSKILKHQLILRDTTTNIQILNQDVGILTSPVSLDLANLIDGHNYTVDLSSSLLANTTSGNAIKTETKSVSFSVPLLSDFIVENFNVTPVSVTRAVTTTINVSVSVRINHTVNNAVLKLFASDQEIYSQNLNSLSPGQMQFSVPLAVTNVPGLGQVSIKIKLTAGASQSSQTKDINILRPQTAASQGHATAI
jgi:hypothetical protein